ncbi:hypothetical protein [Crossiella sp. NPDC003009]
MGEAFRGTSSTAGPAKLTFRYANGVKTDWGGDILRIARYIQEGG